MTHRDTIADFIHRFPGRDDDEISAALGIKPRQSVNQICRALAKAGVIERRPSTSGKTANFPTSGVTDQMPAMVAKAIRSEAGEPRLDVTTDWFWEGNVTDAVARHLQNEGWAVVSQADTRSRAQGIDLRVARNGREMVIEVKGYPSKTYRDPSRAGQPKATSPTGQAQHWYSHALLKVLRLQASHPLAIAAMAFPDFPRYRALFEETRGALQQLGVAVLFVDETGAVDQVAS